MFFFNIHEKIFWSFSGSFFGIFIDNFFGHSPSAISLRTISAICKKFLRQFFRKFHVHVFLENPKKEEKFSSLTSKGSMFGYSSGNFFAHFTDKYFRIFFSTISLAFSFRIVSTIPGRILWQLLCKIRHFQLEGAVLQNDSSVDIDIEKPVSKTLPT